MNRMLMTGALVAMAAMPALASADYPNRPVKLIVGFSAGGPTDIVARAFADQAGQYLQQPFIVENKPGANTIIAATEVAGAKPDGYTLLFGATNHAMIPALYKAKVNFDALKSFAPICTIAASPYVLVVGPSMPAKDLGDFLQLIQAKPGERTYATPGVGSSGHFASVQLLRSMNASMNHIPYKGAAQAMSDVMGGQVDSSLATLGSVMPQIQTGKLKALAVAAATRSPLLPDVPTFEEAGGGRFVADAWYGLLAPAGTPKEVLVKLQDAATRFSKEPDMATKLQVLGLSPQNTCADAFTKQLAQEIQATTELAHDLGLQSE
ncbi:tripartite tricarboxylate transporter substrate-binding protein [Pusillimonas sp. SM2304]|uniref:Bug family tripartite tricarboxylate transporter substrate binding protein n=1 Tax=Pusillimonas sp. SM2304 TaxID=3073241 RepID=UPI002876E807|nr:tripartite tricarboxylate transporter substrate-binding protein [Pusillimonas sp. SM2304]MDS1139426.1 tripartite tricarboxylate transporter substrate-binding protein [Pusillimonas sp. SM2304]